MRIDLNQAMIAKANGGRTGGGAGGGAGRQGIGGIGGSAGAFWNKVDGVSVTPQYMDPNDLPSYFPPFPQNDTTLLSSPVRADADGNLWIRT